MSRTDDKLQARIRAALRSVEGDNGDDSDISDLDTSHFGEVPFDALQSLAQRIDGNAGNGAPLADLFDGMDEEAANRAALTLMSGLSQGPIAIANDLAQVLQITQNRAETIARNELIGSYRDAALANYNANSDVVGEWMWSAALGSACIVCTDMDGSLHPLDEDLVSHILCRCAMLPVTNSWDSILGPLGIDASDIPDTSITDTHQSGADWFAEQGAATQISILGPAKYNAWQSGDLELSDLVGMRTDGAWGASMYERSLKDLGLDAQDYLPFSPSHFTGLGPQGREAVRGAREAIPAPEAGPIRVELPGGGYTFLDPYDIHQFDVGGNMDPAARAGGWQSIDDVMRGLRGETSTAEAAGAVEATEAETTAANRAIADARFSVEPMAPYGRFLETRDAYRAFQGGMGVDVFDEAAQAEAKARVSAELGGRLADNEDYLNLADSLNAVFENNPALKESFDLASDATIQKPEEVASVLLKAWSEGDNPITYTLQDAVRAEFGLGNAATIAENSSVLSDALPGMRAFVREMYNNTQDWLKANDLSEIVAFRGMGWHDLPPGMDAALFDLKSQQIDLLLRPMSSFTVDPDKAWQFALMPAGVKGSINYSQAIAARVPAELILSTPQTGFGALFEHEAVVLGGQYDAVSLGASLTDRADLSARQIEQMLDQSNE